MLELQKEFRGLSKNSNEWQKIKEEIERTDQKIDEEVYKLYGLTPDEIKIVDERRWGNTETSESNVWRDGWALTRLY